MERSHVEGGREGGDRDDPLSRRRGRVEMAEGDGRGAAVQVLMDGGTETRALGVPGRMERFVHPDECHKQAA